MITYELLNGMTIKKDGIKGKLNYKLADWKKFKKSLNMYIGNTNREYGRIRW